VVQPGISSSSQVPSLSASLFTTTPVPSVSPLHVSHAPLIRALSGKTQVPLFDIVADAL
jgi:hypothetical protein